MKNMILTAIITVVVLTTLSSLTYKQAGDKLCSSVHVTFTVPLKPKMTVIVKEEKVYAYLKKGYQVQNAWHDHSTHTNMFVLVKY
jgi:hypothetical protein